MFRSMVEYFKSGLSQVFINRPESFTQEHIDQTSSHSMSPCQTDSKQERVQHKPYDQSQFIAKLGYQHPGMCGGAALLQVTEPGEMELKALEVQQELDDKFVKIPEGEECMQMAMHVLASTYISANEIQNVKSVKTWLQSDEGSPEDAVKFVRGKVSKQATDTNTTTTTILTYMNAFRDNGTEGTHLVTMTKKNGRCRFYDANFGLKKGPCKKVIDDFEQSVCREYGTSIAHVTQIKHENRRNRKTFK